MPERPSIDAAVREAMTRVPRIVLAVSGGRDSMVLMHAAARAAPERISAVVTVDHGTGPAARDAAALVEDTGRSLGLPVIRRAVRARERTEAAWRRVRWAALAREARVRGASIATAHTRDDQIETVLMRVLRQAGARGLAGLASSGTILRPLLAASRAEVAEYAGAHGVPFVDDPTNLDRRYLRNRIRLDILPALARVRPSLPEELADIGDRAAAWRDDVDRALDISVPHERRGDELHVSRSALIAHAPEALRILWPALAARAGVVLDRRGTERLTSFTIEGRRGTRVQLSGGIEVTRHGEQLILRRAIDRRGEAPRRLVDRTAIGAWRFVRVDRLPANGEEWVAALPVDRPLSVRTWRAGDRIVPSGQRNGEARRVKRLLREAGIEAGIRPGWPVVLSGDEIVWVPGVRRGTAATVRSGRPVAVYRCERILDS
jgi:tRNA(Ile)-lysidine synthase